MHRLRLLSSRFRQLAIAMIALTSLPALRAVNLEFTGGNGANQSITFHESFTLTLNQDSLYVRLVFRNIYPAVNSSGISPLTPIAYTLNGVADANSTVTDTLYDWDAPVTSGLGASDFMIPLTDGNVLSGSTYTISPGQVLTTTGGWTPNPASYNPTFDIYLVNLFGARVSNILSGTLGAPAAVPEPSTYAALAGLAALGLTLARRRRLSADNL